MRDVAVYLRVSHQRVTQIHAEGKLPEPDQLDGIGPMWKPATIERWAEREWWGTRQERSFDRAIFDVQIGALVEPSTRTRSIDEAATLVERFQALYVEDRDFSRAVSTTTKSLDATRERFTKWFGVVKDSRAVPEGVIRL